MDKFLNWIENPKRQLIIIVLLWAIVQGLLYLQNGIKPILESLKYIGAAQTLLQTGHLPEVRYFFYLSTTLLLAFCFKFNLSITVAVIIQLLISLFATISFFRALSKLQSRKFSALITTIGLIICTPFYMWNFYLYTESLFYSFVLLFFSHCITHNRITIKTILQQLTLLIFVIISRPLGILFLISWIIQLITNTNKKLQPLLIVGFLSCFAMVVFVSNLILNNISDWQILKPGEFHYIICDIPTGRTFISSNLKGNSPLTQLFLYITTYPQEFFSLALKRLQAFFLLTRSYYSAFHNLNLIIISLLLYIPIVVNIFKRKINIIQSGITLSISTIFLFCIAISLQCDDYHNRFHNTIIPVFLFLGLYKLLENNNTHIKATRE